MAQGDVLTYYKLSGMTVAELRQHCSEVGIEISYKMRKADLIKAITDYLYEIWVLENEVGSEFEKSKPGFRNSVDDKDQMSARVRRLKELNK